MPEAGEAKLIFKRKDSELHSEGKSPGEGVPEKGRKE